MSFKNSEIEWIGYIPKHWKTTNVGRAFNVVLGKMLQPKQINETDRLVPFLKAMNVQDGYLSLDKVDKMFCSPNELVNLNIKQGDLLVCEGGEVARSTLIHENFQGFIFQNSLHRVRGTNLGNVEYLHYLLNVLRNSGFVNILVNKATIAHFTKDKFNSLKIPLPPLQEQLTIVEYINKRYQQIDSLINRKERLRNLLEQQRQSIIIEAVTKGLNPNVKMKDSGVEWIGEIPEHWNMTRIDFVSRVKARLGWKGLKAEEYVDEGYIFLSTPNLKTREIDFNNVNYITEERYLESPEIMLEIGDVLLAKDGSTLGITNVVRHLPKEATVNSSIAVIRPTEKINSVYFYYYLTSTYIQDTINQIKDGMGVPHLFQADIKKFKVILPPINEQKEIAVYLDNETLKLEKCIDLVKDQIEKLKEYRQSLIYEVVTGKVDVRKLELD